MEEMIKIFKDGKMTKITEEEARDTWNSLFDKFPSLTCSIIGMVLDSKNLSVKKYSQDRKISGLSNITYSSNTNSIEFVVSGSGSIPENMDVRTHRYFLEFSDEISDK